MPLTHEHYVEEDLWVFGGKPNQKEEGDVRYSHSMQHHLLVNPQHFQWKLILPMSAIIVILWLFRGLVICVAGRERTSGSIILEVTALSEGSSPLVSLTSARGWFNHLASPGCGEVYGCPRASLASMFLQMAPSVSSSGYWRLSSEILFLGPGHMTRARITRVIYSESWSMTGAISSDSQVTVTLPNPIQTCKSLTQERRRSSVY